MTELIRKRIYLFTHELVYLVQGLGKSMYFTFENTEVSNRQTPYLLANILAMQAGKAYLSQ